MLKTLQLMQAEIQELKRINKVILAMVMKRNINQRNVLIPPSIAGRMEHGVTREKIAGGSQMGTKMQQHSKTKWFEAHIVAYVNNTGVRIFLCCIIVVVN